VCEAKFAFRWSGGSKLVNEEKTEFCGAPNVNVLPTGLKEVRTGLREGSWKEKAGNTGIEGVRGGGFWKPSCRVHVLLGLLVLLIVVSVLVVLG